MNADLFEKIAEHVHKGWAAEKQRQGFADHAWGVSTRSIPPICLRCPLPREKHHADMLPYADLAEHVKEYDRATARAVLDGIEAEGYRLVKAD